MMSDDGEWREMMDRFDMEMDETRARYDQLASIAGEMALALSNTLNTTRSEYKCGNIYGVFDEDYAAELAALSRYNKWVEKQK